MKKFLGKLENSFQKLRKDTENLLDVQESFENFKNITRKVEENFEKTKSKFWRNFVDKKYIKSKLIRNTPFTPNRASLSHLPIASYLNLIYIRATAWAIREETIFVDAGSGRLPIYTQKW